MCERAAGDHALRINRLSAYVCDPATARPGCACTLSSRLQQLTHQALAATPCPSSSTAGIVCLPLLQFDLSAAPTHAVEDEARLKHGKQ